MINLDVAAALDHATEFTFPSADPAAYTYRVVPLDRTADLWVVTWAGSVLTTAGDWVHLPRTAELRESEDFRATAGYPIGKAIHLAKLAAAAEDAWKIPLETSAVETNAA